MAFIRRRRCSRRNQRQDQNGVKGFTELDNKEKLLRVISASPFIPITVSACKSDPAFVAVGCYRLVAIVGRLLLVLYFQVLTHDVLKLPFGLHLGAKGVWQPAIGASLLLTLDFGIQAALVYRSTANLRKLGWTFANVVSPTEPILHGGSQPMFTTSPRVAAGVHAAEALVAACVVIWAQGGVGSTTTFLQVNLRTIYHMMLAICGCCCLLQLPMLLLVQQVFAYRLEPSETWGEAFDLAPSNAHLNTTDLAAPVHMILIARAIDTVDARSIAAATTSPIRAAMDLARVLKTEKVLQSTAEVMDLSKRNIETPGSIVYVLKMHKQLKSLDLGENKIGEAGAKAFAEALKQNQRLESLNLCACEIDSAGAQALGEALKENQSLKDLV